MELRTVTRSFASPSDWIDYCSTSSTIYFLCSDYFIRLYNYNGVLLQEFKLHQNNVKATSIFIDKENLLVGFVNGTMEIRLVSENYNILRISSTADAGGPGNKVISKIGASRDYVLVHASENGLMIYSKPSMLFYKWIMLGGHCTIDTHSIEHHIMYVMRDNHEIHMLDFEKHRIFEQAVMTYDYVDIEYDGLYLYAATSSSVLIYLQEDVERPQKPMRVSQINFKDRIKGLIKIGSLIGVVFSENLSILDVAVPQKEQPIVTVKNSFIIDHEISMQLKYNYLLREENLVTQTEIPIFLQDNPNTVDLIQIGP